MNQSEERLAQAFQALAEESPQSAPADIGLALQNAFRQHHVRRRRQRWLITAGALGACLVVAAALVSKTWSSGPQVKQAVFLLFLLLLLTLVVIGQTDRPGSIQRQSGITLNSAEVAGREELVKNAPYVATANVESTQILADGNRIVHSTQELVARDA